MLCHYCGKEIPAEVVYCPYCGRTQDHNGDVESSKKRDDSKSVFPKKNSKGKIGLLLLLIGLLCATVGIVVAIRINKNNDNKQVMQRTNGELSETQEAQNLSEQSDENETVPAEELQSTDVPYDFEALEIDDDRAFALGTPGLDNGEYVDVKPIFEQYGDMGSVFYNVKHVAEGDEEHRVGYGRYFHGYSVTIYSIEDPYKGDVEIRGLNSNKTLAIIPVTVFDDNTICSYGEGDPNAYHTSFGYTYVKSIENLKKVLEILESTDNYNDEDKCPLEHSFIYHVHPSSKNQSDTSSKPEDFSPYADYFDIEEYFKSWQTNGSVSYSSSSTAYESFGLKADQHYCANYRFNGWELEIMYADQEELWGSDSGKIILRDGHTSEVIASIPQPQEGARRKVVIDQDGNTTYEGTLVNLTQIMPDLVNQQAGGYCPLDDISIEHKHWM